MLTSYRHTMEMYEKADLILTPPVKSFGMMEWNALPKLIEIGYTYTKKILSELPETEKKKFR